MTAAVFAPIFFATAGLRVDLGLLADGETIMWALIVLAIASLSKFLGSILGAQLSFLPLREGAALGGEVKGRHRVAGFGGQSYQPIHVRTVRGPGRLEYQPISERGGHQQRPQVDQRHDPEGRPGKGHAGRNHRLRWNAVRLPRRGWGLFPGHPHGALRSAPTTPRLALHVVQGPARL